MPPRAEAAGAPTAPAPRAAGGRRALALLFLGALVLRVAAIFALDTPRLAEGGDPWRWGAESACLAASLAEGRGYGDPWCHGTGASSWLTPVYPGLIALLMRIYDGVTRETALALHLVQSVLSAATCVLVVRIGARLGLPRAGLLGGLLLAASPLSVWHAAQTVWDTTLVAFGVAGVLELALWARGRAGRVAVAGLAYGALLFLNPAPVALLPALAAFLAWRAGGLGRGAVHAGLFAALAFLVCVPWMLRNQRELGAFTLRPNFGVELRIGNHAEATGRPVPFRYHPSHVEDELALYRELGEVAYARDNSARARAWIRAKPGRFAELTWHRARIFWLGEWPAADPRRSDGLAPGRDLNSWIKFWVYALSGAGALVALLVLDLPGPERLLVTGSLLLFGLPYFVTHVSERYRFPVEPLVVLLDAHLLVRAGGALARRRTTGSAA